MSHELPIRKATFTFDFVDLRVHLSTFNFNPKILNAKDQGEEKNKKVYDKAFYISVFVISIKEGDKI